MQYKVLRGLLLFAVSLAAGVLAAVIAEHCVQATESVNEEAQTGDAGMDDEAVAAFGGRQCDELTKKIAITFDDDVIIGLSQEISYKEAVSMI